MVVSAALMSAARLADPATTAASTAARTRAYSSRSCPDSSRCRLLTNCKNFIFNFLLYGFLAALKVAFAHRLSNRLHKGQDQFLHTGTCPFGCIHCITYANGIAGSGPRER